MTNKRRKLMNMRMTNLTCSFLLDSSSVKAGCNLYVKKHIIAFVVHTKLLLIGKKNSSDLKSYIRRDNNIKPNYYYYFRIKIIFCYIQYHCCNYFEVVGH